jgi:putative tricarboxylic transport membrane protein
MKKDDGKSKLHNSLLLCMSIFFLLLLMTADGKAADPSADYPSKPIDIICHSGPGSSNDTVGRMMAEIIQRDKILNQPLIILNKTGSGGAVAFGYVFERKGNPYTVLFVPSGSFLCTPLLEKLPYNYKSFVPIANVLADGSVLVVKSDSPFKTAEDLIAEARKRPKELIQGGSSFTGNESMMGRSMQKVKGVQWNFISFPNDREALINVLNGNVHFSFANPSYILDFVRTGKMRVLLSGAPNRYTQFKDVRTIGEAGMGEAIVTYRGLAGPPNMPAYAVKKLEALFKRIMDHPRFKKFVEDVAMQPFWLSSNEYGKFLEEESDKWKDRLKDLDVLKK